MTDVDTRYREHLDEISARDLEILKRKDDEYGASWRARGGNGAFMMLARKWDRLENAAKQHGWDIFAAALADGREESVADDLRDIRTYALLIAAEIAVRCGDRVDITGARRAAPAHLPGLPPRPAR